MKTARVLGAADAIPSDIDNFSALDLWQRDRALLHTASARLGKWLGKDISALGVTDFVGFGPSIYNQHPYLDGAKKANSLGLSGIRYHNIDMGGASVVGGIQQAWLICQQNPRAVVLLAGVDVPRSGIRQADVKKLNEDFIDATRESPHGVAIAAAYGLLASHSMNKHGISVDEYHAIASHFRQYAVDNPRAMNYQKEIKPGQLDKHIASPYGAPSSAVVSDHAFACLVVGDDITKSNDSVFIRGAGHCLHAKYLVDKGKLATPARSAAVQAYQSANLKPTDIDYANIYDCFVGVIAEQASAYFGVDVLDATRALARGQLNFEGKSVDVNRSGGLLNYNAGGMISSATGLLDVLNQFGLAADGPGKKVDKAPSHALLGGNGGVDSINVVALLSKEAGDGAFGEVPLPVEPLTLNRADANDGDNGRVIATTSVRLDPSRTLKTPYVIALAERDDGNFSLANVVTKQGGFASDIAEVLLGSEITFKQREGLLQMVLN